MLQSPSLMQHLSSSGIEPSWFDYPIVALAQRQASGDPLGTLERLSSLLGHIEDRCPNVDYVNLFESHHLDGPDARMLADQYRRLGLSDDSETCADPDLLGELFPTVDISVSASVADRRAVASDLRSQGWKLKDIAAELGCTIPNVWSLLNTKNRTPNTTRKGLTAETVRLGSYRLDLPAATAAKLLGTYRQRIYQARKAVKERAA